VPPLITSSPTRTQIMQILSRDRRSTLTDLRRETGLSPTALRQQLVLLERDGLVRRALVRGRPGQPGRPPIVYQPTAAVPPASEGNVAALLSAVFRTVEEQASDRFGQMLEDVAGRLAAEHRHIARIPSVEARIRAALAVLFDVFAGAEVDGSGREYEVIIRHCPLRPAAQEFPGLCAVTRRLLGTLVGADVTQQESIVEGDPYCRFRLTLPGGARARH